MSCSWLSVLRPQTAITGIPARAAARAGIPVIAVCGRSTLSPEQLAEAGFTAVHALTDFEPNVEKCMAEAGPLLEELGKHIGVHLPVNAARTDTKENVHV